MSHPGVPIYYKVGYFLRVPWIGVEKIDKSHIEVTDPIRETCIAKWDCGLRAWQSKSGVFGGWNVDVS